MKHLIFLDTSDNITYINKEYVTTRLPNNIFVADRYNIFLKPLDNFWNTHPKSRTYNSWDVFDDGAYLYKAFRKYF